MDAPACDPCMPGHRAFRPFRPPGHTRHPPAQPSDGPLVLLRTGCGRGRRAAPIPLPRRMPSPPGNATHRMLTLPQLPTERPAAERLARALAPGLSVPLVVVAVLALPNRLQPAVAR